MPSSGVSHEQHEHRSMRRQVWIIATVFFFSAAAIVVCGVVLIPASTLQEIQNGLVPEKAGDGDFLKLSLAILGIFATFVLGFLGLKRLEQFDTEINRLRDTLAESLRSERAESKSDRDTFRADVQGQMSREFGEFRSIIKTVAENAIKDSISEKVQRAERVVADYASAAGTQMDRIREQLAPFGWLNEYQEQQGDAGQLLGIRSIGVAHDHIARLFRSQRNDEAIRVCENVITRELRGAATDFHNLSAELARHDLHGLARRIVSQGLQYFPNDCDLLSDAIKYAEQDSDLEAGQQCLDRLIKRVGKAAWNWRAFEFSADLLLARQQIDDAKKIFEEFQQLRPYDERGWSGWGEWLRGCGRFKEACAVFQDAVDKVPRAPRSAHGLASTLVELGRYEEAIAAASKAIRMNASEQPTLKPTAITWLRATATDCLIHEMVESAGTDAAAIDRNRLKSMVTLCSAEYRMCANDDELGRFFGPRGEERVAYLRSLMHRAGCLESEIEEAIGSQPVVVTRKATIEELAQLMGEAARGRSARSGISEPTGE